MKQGQCKTKSVSVLGFFLVGGAVAVEPGGRNGRCADWDLVIDALIAVIVLFAFFVCLEVVA